MKHPRRGPAVSGPVRGPATVGKLPGMSPRGLVGLSVPQSPPLESQANGRFLPHGAED